MEIHQLLLIFIPSVLFPLPVCRKRMKLRGTSSWENCRRRKKKWGKCLSKELKRRRPSSKKQRKRYIGSIISVYVSRTHLCSCFSHTKQPSASCRSCTRSSTVWRNSTRTRKRSWRIRRSPWTMKSTHSNRKRLLQSSCRIKPSRQGAPPHSRGTKRGKSEYCVFILTGAPMAVWL